MRLNAVRLALVGGLFFLVACSSSPAQAPAPAPAPRRLAPAPAAPAAAPAAASPAAAAAASPAAAAAASPAAAAAASPAAGAAASPAAAAEPGGAAAVSQAAIDALDADLKPIYAEAVKTIPNLPPELLTGAKKEGGLSLYRLNYDIQGTVYPEFNRLFPFVKITDFEATTGALLQRFSSEARAGRTAADVIMNSDVPAIDDLDKEGLLMPYEPTSSAAFSEGVKKGVYYPFGYYLLAFAYNPQLVSEADAAGLATYESMLDPKWRGKAATVRYGVGGSGILPYYLINKEKGQDFWNKMLEQQLQVFTSIPVMIERLGAGGLSVAYFANDGNLSDIMKKGTPLRWRYPEPTLALYIEQFIAKDAPHPNAAKLWIEFLLAKSSQSKIMQGIGLRTPRIDMTDERTVTKESWYKAPGTLYKYTWDDVGKERKALQDKWDGSVNQLKDSGA